MQNNTKCYCCVDGFHLFFYIQCLLHATHLGECLERCIWKDPRFKIKHMGQYLYCNFHPSGL